MYHKANPPVIMTLDAGGTNFVFSAIKDGEEVVSPVSLPSNAHDLDLCLKNIIKGFESVKSQLSKKPVAISFAFPGAADYINGVIGDLHNLPAFRGGVALGPMLEDHFQMPVFINNDGDLFAYGEATFGLLPFINKKFENNGDKRKYKNLLGVTLGTGFGAGIVHNGQLYLGDNSAGAEIWVTRNAFEPKVYAEESISIRAVQREYANKTGNPDDSKLTPKQIYDIALGKTEGDADAAKFSFNMMGKVLGDVLANAITLLDCNVVIGGGLSNAYKLFAQAMMEQLNGKISKYNGNNVDRLEVKCFNLEDSEDRQAFFQNKPIMIKVPGSNRQVIYNRDKKVGIGLSKLGTNKAVALGAYAYAIEKIKNANK